MQKNDTEVIHAYTKQHSELPNVNMKDHKTMMKSNSIKKEVALNRIKERRHRDKEVEVGRELFGEDEEIIIDLPDGILPPDAEELRSDTEKVNKKAYSVMEWLLLTTSSNSADVGAPRFKVFNSWGKLVSLIALCVPSSAADERVFSLLLLYRGKNKNDMLHDELEASMIMRVNDVHV